LRCRKGTLSKFYDKTNVSVEAGVRFLIQLQKSNIAHPLELEAIIFISDELSSLEFLMITVACFALAFEQMIFRSDALIDFASKIIPPPLLAIIFKSETVIKTS